jgi:hypothetical protein
LQARRRRGRRRRGYKGGAASPAWTGARSRRLCAAAPAQPGPRARRYGHGRSLLMRRADKIDSATSQARGDRSGRRRRQPPARRPPLGYRLIRDGQVRVMWGPRSSGGPSVPLEPASPAAEAPQTSATRVRRHHAPAVAAETRLALSSHRQCSLRPSTGKTASERRPDRNARRAGERSQLSAGSGSWVSGDLAESITARVPADRARRGGLLLEELSVHRERARRPAAACASWSRLGSRWNRARRLQRRWRSHRGAARARGSRRHQPAAPRTLPPAKIRASVLLGVGEGRHGADHERSRGDGSDDLPRAVPSR